MRDLVYLNSIYESLDEGVGIKTTKLKPFYDAATGYESQRNPHTDHGELRNPTRRAVKYDYGKATYDEISAEEAIRLVKQDKHNIQKLRIIYRLSDKESLVEYEVRDNGSVYAIYGSSNPITIDGKQYKNIRYAPWKKVLENADLIYITDEYDKYLDADPDVSQARADRNKYAQLPMYADRTSPSYDPHNTYANAYTGGSTDRYDTPGRYAQLNVDTGAHRATDRYVPAVAKTIKPYLDAVKNVQTIYEQLDRYRRALKKLENDREALGEDEYNRKKERWEKAYKQTLDNYRAAIAEMKKIEAKVDKEIDERSAAFAAKLRTNIYDYDQALKRGFELTSKIQELKSKLVGDLATASSTGSYDFRQASKRLEEAAQQLIAAKKALEEILAEMEADQETIANAEDQVTTAADLFNSRLEAVNALKLEELYKNLKQIEDIAEELRQIDAKLAELRPKAAAAKAARAAKNKTAELDPDLVDILDFGDDDASDDANGDSEDN